MKETLENRFLWSRLAARLSCVGGSFSAKGANYETNWPSGSPGLSVLGAGGEGLFRAY